MLRYDSLCRKGLLMLKIINFKRFKRKEIIVNFIILKKREEFIIF